MTRFRVVEKTEQRGWDQPDVSKDTCRNCLRMTGYLLLGVHAIQDRISWERPSQAECERMVICCRAARAKGHAKARTEHSASPQFELFLTTVRIEENGLA